MRSFRIAIPAARIDRRRAFYERKGSVRSDPDNLSILPVVARCSGFRSAAVFLAYGHLDPPAAAGGHGRMRP
jgi:hypothetical protein